MNSRNLLRFLLLPIALFTLVAAPLGAQSTSTGSVVVVVVDQAGAVVKDAKVSVVNAATGAARESVSGGDGSATIAALPLTGTYTVTVSKSGFGDEAVKDLALVSGETATLKVKLQVGAAKAEVVVYGTTEGVRADPQIGRRFDDAQIDDLPLLGRKISNLPLLNSAFRPAKGTGDLFVNTTYFVTGAGGRRETTVSLDGGSDDEGWGRQVALITVPLGAIQEMRALTNAFSSEYGWTAGPALNIVTKSGTNSFHGEEIYMLRPPGWQDRTFSTTGFCPPSITSCVTPSTLKAVTAPDIPDKLNQFSGSLGGALVKDKTFFFVAADYTAQDRVTYLSNTLPAFVLPANGNLSYTGKYRQELADMRLDQVVTPNQTFTLRGNIDRFYDTNPQDAVGGTSAPNVARKYARRGWSIQANHTWVLKPNLLNEARFNFLDGDPVTEWDAQTLSTTYTRTGSVPFTIGQSRTASLYSRQGTFADYADVDAWPSQPAHRRERGPSHLGRRRRRARHRATRYVHLQDHYHGALRSIDAGGRAAVFAAHQLRHLDL